LAQFGNASVLFERVGVAGMGEWGARTLSLPPPFRARGLQGASQMPEQGGMWAGGDECEPNAPCGLDEASAYFQEFFAQGREFGDGQRMSLGILSRRSSINQYAAVSK
jgi:hypothetical protein